MSEENLESESGKALDELRKSLLKGDMSLFVGSGFSKNANSNFPTWPELLHDLTYELYSDEVLFKYKLENQTSKKDIIFNDFKEEQIKVIMEREGYSELASQYIKRKGRREAITGNL